MTNDQSKNEPTVGLLAGWKIKGLKIACLALAAVTVLAPQCLLGESRRSYTSRNENIVKMRNEIEEHWQRQYRSYSPSESENESRGSRRRVSLYEESSMMSVSRRNGSRRRSTYSTAGARDRYAEQSDHE